MNTQETEALPGPMQGPRASGSAPAVLMATDGSAQSVKAARVVAGLLSAAHAKVRLITVLSMELTPYSYLGDLSDAEARRAKIDEATEKAVEEVRQIFGEVGITTTVRRRFGNPADEILSEIAEWDPDLVVVGRRGLSRPASLVLGSVSSSLLHHSRVPVLVVP